MRTSGVRIMNGVGTPCPCHRLPLLHRLLPSKVWRLMAQCPLQAGFAYTLVNTPPWPLSSTSLSDVNVQRQVQPLVFSLQTLLPGSRAITSQSISSVSATSWYSDHSYRQGQISFRSIAAATNLTAIAVSLADRHLAYNRHLNHFSEETSRAGFELLSVY